MSVADTKRIQALHRAGLNREAVAAVFGVTLDELHAIASDPDNNDLPAGGGGGGAGTVVHATDVPDQTITLADDSWSFPQHLADLWRVEGPGFWMLGLWYEVKPFDDNDQVMCQVMGTPEPGGAGRAFSVGPDSRAYASVGGSGSLAPGGGGWLRERGGDFSPVLLMPSEYQDFVLNIAGFHYNDADQGNFDIPLLGDVQIRNMRAIAVQLGA